MARKSITRTGAQDSRESSAMADRSPQMPLKTRCSFWHLVDTAVSPMTAGDMADQASHGMATIWTPMLMTSRSWSKRST
ncbi:MAG: hypothetical protein WB392_12185 [Methanotrichaceae archaeon]